MKNERANVKKFEMNKIAGKNLQLIKTSSRFEYIKVIDIKSSRETFSFRKLAQSIH